MRSTSASRLNLSIFPHPLFNVFPFKTGVVWLLACSPGRRQNWLLIQLGMGWFHPAGQSNNPRQKSNARPRSTPWGAPGWEPRHKELKLAKEFWVSLLASLDGYSARESFLGSPRCVLERNLGHASGSSCCATAEIPQQRAGYMAQWHWDLSLIQASQHFQLQSLLALEIFASRLPNTARDTASQQGTQILRTYYNYFFFLFGLQTLIQTKHSAMPWGVLLKYMTGFEALQVYHKIPLSSLTWTLEGIDWDLSKFPCNRFTDKG